MLTAQRQIEMADNQPRGEMAMPEHQTPLIATIAAGLMLAFIFGLIAHRLRVRPLVGYLLAGVMVGPYTPGFEADPALAAEHLATLVQFSRTITPADKA
jgi:predicted Kef-type K+ transport protein